MFCSLGSRDISWVMVVYMPGVMQWLLVMDLLADGSLIDFLPDGFVMDLPLNQSWYRRSVEFVQILLGAAYDPVLLSEVVTPICMRDAECRVVMLNRIMRLRGVFGG